MSLTSSGISDSSTPDACRRGNNGSATLIPPRRCDVEETSVLTNLNVTFLLFWGSSTIFCKLAATERIESITPDDDLGPQWHLHSENRARGVTYRWPGPSRQPDLLRPTPEKLHQRNLSPERGKVQLLDNNLARFQRKVLLFANLCRTWTQIGCHWAPSWNSSASGQGWWEHWCWMQLDPKTR